MATPEKHQSSPQSPTAIPPRTSSNTGMNGLNQAILKPGLQSLPEEDWISSGKKPSHSRNTSLTTTTTAAPTTSGHHRRRSSSGMPHPPSQGSSWSPEKEKILMGPFEYLFEHPGKDIRSQLITAFNAWLKVPERSLEVITKVVGMLHTSSLLIDDVEDSSLLRRGIPVAHSIFGVAQTINSANYTYILALRSLSTLSNPLAISIYTDEMLNLHRGQGMELYWRDTLTCPTESDYLEMVGNKTGGLFRLAVKLMMAERTPESAPRDLVPLVNTIGQLFQIRDDYLNLRSPAYAANKGLCEDLTEGKFSFPIIHAVRADPANLQLLNILRQRSTDEDVKRYAVAYMERVGSFAYTRDVIEALGERAKEMVKALDREGEGDQLMGFLAKMAI